MNRAVLEAILLKKIIRMSLDQWQAMNLSIGGTFATRGLLHHLLQRTGFVFTAHGIPNVAIKSSASLPYIR